MKKFLIIIILFLSVITTASAADLSLVAPNSISNREQFVIDLQVNTDKTSINSIDIGVQYPKDLFVFKGYKKDGGVVQSWFKSPTEENGIIEMIGIIPGGVEGTYDPDKQDLGPLSLVKLIFESKENGQGNFSIKHSSILLNDSHGSPLIYNVKDLNVKVISSSKINKEENLDKEPPEFFEVSYIDSNFFSKTPAMIIFEANDVLSGIEKYQMNDDGATWFDVKSPFPVKKGFFRREVLVRAIDYSGNIKESNVIVPGYMSSIWIFIVIILFAIFAYLRFMWYKKRDEK